MSTTTAVIVTAALCLSIGLLGGWYLRPPRDPSENEIARYMDRHWYLVEQEQIRKNRAMLHDANRRTMPFENDGPPSRVSRMRLSTPRRKGQN